MKVLQINSVCGYGSTGRIAKDLYEMIEKQGDECCIAYGRGSAPVGIKTIKIGTELDVKIHGLYTRVTDKHGFASKKATIEFIKRVEEYDPDVIHLHNIHGYYINVEILFDYLKKVRKPVMWTLHDCWAFTGHCIYFDYVVCDKWKEGCNNCPQKSNYPTSLLIDNSEWNYNKKKELFAGIEQMTIVTPSVWLSKLVKESFFGKYPVEVIHNGIDLNIFKPTESNFREKHGLQDKKIILGVANVWEERKGLKYFLELVDMLDNTYQIVLVGLTDKQIKGMDKRIIGITRTDSVEELAGIYTVADVFVNPTLEDNFPTVNLEALACGTPVVTFDTGGSSECINERNGIVVDKGDLNGLFNSIKIIQDVKSSDCIIQSMLFNSSKMQNTYLKLYHSY